MGYTFAGVPYRLNVDALKLLPGGVTMVAFIADVDDSEAHLSKLPASDAWRSTERAKIATFLQAHPEAFIYETKGGYRIVMLLREPFLLKTEEDVHRWKIVYLLSAASLSRRFNIVGDPVCRDWTRFYRLPYVVRDGVREQRPVYGDPHKLGSWTYSIVQEDETELDRLAAENKVWGAARRALDEKQVPREISASELVSEGMSWDRQGKHVQGAIDLLAKHFPRSGRHHFSLALSGMLRRSRVKLEDSYHFVYEVCRRGGSDNPHARAANVFTTWQRYESEGQTTGFTTVGSIIGDLVAKQAGSLITDAVNHAWINSIWGHKKIAATAPKLEAAVTVVPPMPDTVAVPIPAAPPEKEQVIDLKALRKLASKLKSKKFKVEDPDKNIQGVLLNQFLDGKPLFKVPNPAESLPEGVSEDDRDTYLSNDEITGLDREKSVNKLMGLLAFKFPLGTPWEAVSVLARPCIAAMDTKPDGLDQWLEFAQFGYERSMASRIASEAQRAAEQEAVRERYCNALRQGLL